MGIHVYFGVPRRVGAVACGTLMPIAVWYAVSWAQPERTVMFDRETIAVYVDGKSITVDGLYIFKNPSDVPQQQQLLYPFPVDSLHPFPERIVVRREGRPVPFRKTDDGVLFSLDVPPGSEAAVQVVYKQRCMDDTGCYILTSTSAWERPLSAADFEIVVAAGVELESVSYDAGAPEETRGIRRYSFGFKDFAPEKDLCLRWAPGADR